MNRRVRKGEIEGGLEDGEEDGIRRIGLGLNERVHWERLRERKVRGKRGGRERVR